MNDMQLLEFISKAISPAKNIRVHFISEAFDHSLTSRMPPEVDKELLLPIFEYTLTLCDKGWMYLETMKGGCLKKYKEERPIRKTFHSWGSYFGRRSLDSYYGTSFARLTRLSDFWAEFMGYDIHRYDGPELHWLNIPIYEKDGFYSAGRPGVRYLFDGSKGARVVRVQYLFPDGRVNFESIRDIKQFPNGVWFQMGYDMMRYADPQTGREARFHRCVRVTDVEFDIEINKKTVELPEGVDAITRPT